MFTSARSNFECRRYRIIIKTNHDFVRDTERLAANQGLLVWQHPLWLILQNTIWRIISSVRPERPKRIAWERYKTTGSFLTFHMVLREYH